MADNKLHRRLLTALQWGFAVIAVVLVTLIVVRIIHSKQRIAEEVESSTDFSLIQETDSAPASQSAHRDVFPQVQALLERNPDFVGMIGFDDMALYVCRGSDNSYYASHRFDGTQDSAGMIYMDYRCSLDPMSDNIVLYGHNMNDGSRFGKLKRYSNIDYLLAHSTFRLATLYEIHEYTPFAVFYTTVNPDDPAYFDFAQTNFPSEEAFEAYVQGVRERSLFFLPGHVDSATPLLTLATCSSVADRGRLVIVLRQAK